MHVSQVSLVLGWNWSTQLHMQEVTQLLGENAHFYMGARFVAQAICTIFGQSS